MDIPKFEGNPEWKETLELLGPEVVAMALMGSPGSSHGSIPIGPHISMTRGFAQEWLADKKREQAAADEHRQESLVKAGKSSAYAAMIAAAAALFAAGGTVIQAYAAWKTWELQSLQQSGSPQPKNGR